MTNNTTFPGTLTCPTSSVSNAMTMGTTKTYVVTVSDASGANKFYIDGYLQASLVLHQGQTYIFDLSSSGLFQVTHLNSLPQIMVHTVVVLHTQQV